MHNWKDTLRLDEDEYVASYKSSFFNKEIEIRFMGTNDQVSIRQEQLIDTLIADEREIMNASIASIIIYYKKYYEAYREGWESGGAEDAMIEKYLPKEITTEKLIKLIDPVVIKRR